MLAFLLSSTIASAAATCGMAPAHLRTNNLEHPLGIPSLTPLLSWELRNTTSPPTRGQRQSAYQITCFATAKRVGTPLWDSGKVESAETLQVPYGGGRLGSSQGVWWSVSVWDSSGAACPAGDGGFFETALQGEAGWGDAAWIARYAEAPNASGTDGCKLYNSSIDRNQVPRFRTEFDADSASVVSARAYIVGLGYYQLFIDGERVGNSYLDPGWTTYSKHTLYATHDVTKFFASTSSANTKKHAVGVELGNGWWNPLPLKMWGHVDVRSALVGGEGRAVNGETSEPMFRCKIVATMKDGSQTVLTTSSTTGWKAGGSPTTFNNIYLGEKYDARLEAAAAGWSSAGFNDAGWTSPIVADSSSLGTLEAQAVPPIRRQATLKATILSSEVRGEGGSPLHGLSAASTTMILDVGRNNAGVCRYQIAGEAGDVVAMRYGELLAEDGSLNPMTSVAGQIKGATENVCIENIIGTEHIAYQADSLTLSGAQGGDDWTPSWSWHGFRFIELTLPAGAGLTADVECYPMRTDVALISNFTSSEPFLTELRTLSRNTFDANLMSIQSDCPHRERFGYGGDPLGSGEAGLSIYDFSTFYRKRVQDFNDAVRLDATSGNFGGFPETAPFVNIADASLIPGDKSGPIGWETYQPVAQLWLYKYYGDTVTLKESFNLTLAYVSQLDTEPSGIESGLGDWMPVQSTSSAFTGLGFQRMSYLAFANISAILGETSLAQTYRTKAAAVDVAINAKFLDVTRGAYNVSKPPRWGPPGSTNKDSQCGQGMALFMGIVPPASRTKALAVMVQNAKDSHDIRGACQGGATLSASCKTAKGGAGPHMTAGLFGIKWFLMALADGGLNDLAYDVITSTTYPGYRWMMHNEYANATTLWESWFVSDNTFSHNHPMFASSEVWLVQSIGGLQPHPAAKGMDRILIKPSPPTKLQNASLSYDTPRGRVTIAWSRQAGGKLLVETTVPPNVLATVHIPSRSNTTVRESGVPLLGGRREATSLVVEVGSGTYAFESQF